MSGWEGRAPRPAVLAQPGAPTAPRMLVISARPQEFAAVVGSAATVVALPEQSERVGAGYPAADLVLLHSAEPLWELAALSPLVSRVPCLLIASTSHVDAVAWLRAGACSVLVEGQFTRWELLDAVHATAHGQSRLSPGAVAAVVGHLRRPGPDPVPDRPELTRREREVIRLLVGGDSNTQIAAALGLAEKTVRNQVSRVYRKLGVRNRAQATGVWLAGRPVRPRTAPR
ncbi:response regulator transcription factor [Catellatospora sp. KI3]|uniref:LuxR C-terminal-related transcriptional regulator n=1 Tax=Catellatospora sp. KI3 TaxID=3041620 RepID=UPI002482422A|nr:response regulator transcription factor [Catellatospora sp. KI3]MDI1464496.1 response regulator transcription factor [Catellatospora sp. KI3]